MIGLKDNLLEIMQVYQRTKSLEKTAEDLQISTSKIRRALLTLGFWNNATSERIKEIRSEHPDWENSRIAKELNISLKTVQMYTPYGKYTAARETHRNPPAFREEYDGNSCEADQSADGFRQTPPKSVGQCGDTVWWRLFDDGRLEIVGTGKMWNSFDCSDIRYEIRDIMIGDEVTGIGTSAFSYCSFLREVRFGRKVQTVGPRAFYRCRNLTRITIADDTIDTWGEVDIFEDDPIITVYVPATVRQIPSEVLNIPSLMRFVCEMTEENCTKGFYSVDGILYYRDAGHGIREIVKCPSSKPLYSYKIPDGITTICPDCFKTFGQRQTLEEVELPESLTAIDYSAFFGNKMLKRVVIPDGVKKIGQAAFYGCSSLEEAVFGRGLASIGICAFRLCEALRDPVIPENVSVIGDEAFGMCGQIHCVTFLGGAPRVKEHDYYHEGVFGRRGEDFRVRYAEGKDGWTEEWMGYRTEADRDNHTV